MGEVPKGEVKQSKWPLIISMLIIAGLTGSYFLVDPFQQFIAEAYSVLTSDDNRRISKWVNGLGAWGPTFIMGAMVIQMFLLVIPSPLLMVVSVLAYGPWVGAVISVAAVFLASTVGYWIGRSLGIVTVSRLLGPDKER
jgi:uncharacterized membrane protein YdjX (TVP38/TMEM64 family)